MTRHHTHVTALQSGRGIAAGVVVVQHCLFVFKVSGPLAAISPYAANAANAAVVFFFVLSGYVLTLSLRDKPESVLTSVKFYAQRCWRIFPALWLGCLLALPVAIYIWPFRSGPEYSSWFAIRYASSKLNIYYVIMSFLGFVPYLVPPAWSIFVEFAGSGLMPFISYAIRRRAVFALLVFSVIALGIFFPNKGYYAGMYLVDFVIGATLIDIAPRVTKYLHIGRGLPFVLPALAYMIAIGVNYNFARHLLLAFSAAMLICTILSRPGWPVLESRLLKRLGDISYSVYILHFPIMSAIAVALGIAVRISPNALTFLLIAITLPTVILASELSYRFVELPGIKAGRAFNNSLFGRWSIQNNTVHGK